MRNLVGRVANWVSQERGDVPGWVLITLMTAGLVVLIWAAAGPKLVALFQNAVDSVTGPAGP
ncbi:hypothetical protein [Buchananella felis]|uniref:hypothetical protein n=1 Tax=Buchananella felis TaxID=3231492 RepID=UPI00352703D1